ncbi:MAG: hypothetical protein JNM85_00505 [Chthonomonas sp.]|nr:hypothetical protein [Chthonomonas sp.]
MTWTPRIFAVLLGAALVALAATQPAPEAFRSGVPGTTDPQGTLHFETQVGSFKLLDGQGRVDMTFRGTVMLNLKPGANVQTFGKIRKQYEGRGRVVYFGEGRMVFVGKWRSAQFFGKNLKATWFGHGRVRIISEFFKDPKTGELVTGQFWYDDPSDKEYWFTGGTQEIPLPRPKEESISPTPRERKD